MKSKNPLVWVENDLNGPWRVTESSGRMKDLLALARDYPEQHKRVPKSLANKLAAAQKALDEVSKQVDDYEV